MELSTELILLICTIVIAWVGWVSTVTIRNQIALSNLKTSDVNLHKDMENLSKSLKESFSEMKDEVKEQINRVNTRLDIFLKDEITVLKELAKK